MAATVPSVEAGPSIPLIDFAPFLSSTSDKATTATSLLNAFQTAGFIYLKNHGVPAPLLDSAFSHSKAFFQRPIEQKESLRWTTPEANRGYVCYGREKNAQSLSKSDVDALRSSALDLKESMEIGREAGPYPNHWPDKIDQEGVEFKATMLELMGRLDALHGQVMSCIAVGLGLGEDFFKASCEPGDNNLRLLHYPPVKKSLFVDNAAQVRLGAHSDYGSVTLLFQDTCGGLQVESPSGSGVFVDVPPVEGTVVVNAGDLLARWANDKIKSTLHRVVEPDRRGEVPVKGRDGEEWYKARYAVVYFCNPGFEEMIETLPGTYENEEDKVYKEAIKCKDHLVQRLKATY